ncbi:hypothetical protein B0H21DRAFT_738891 [Amylocystis lapponica]|nr:hypothetical protein B0H21DRAFT_738891 [Amylocystis lapponica]
MCSMLSLPPCGRWAMAIPDILPWRNSSLSFSICVSLAYPFGMSASGFSMPMKLYQFISRGCLEYFHHHRFTHDMCDFPLLTSPFLSRSPTIHASSLTSRML